MKINTRQLEIFAAVYENSNMTAAAELYISQPSVSQAIREIENTYGFPLFERYARNLSPTEKGRLLYGYAKQILDMQNEADKEMQRYSDQPRLSIGANISAGTVLIHKYISAFKEKYPDAKIRVRVAGSKKLKAMLLENKIDIALMEDIVEDASIIQEPFYNDKIVVVCAPENPLAKKKNLKFKDLEKCDFILRDKGVGVRDKFDYLMLINNIEIDPLWESTNNGAIVNAVKRNYGIGVMPYLIAKEKLDNGEICLVDVEEESLNRKLNIVYHKSKPLNKYLTEFMNLVRESDEKTKNEK